MTNFKKLFLAIFLFFTSFDLLAVVQVDIYTQSVLVEKNANVSRVDKVRQQAMLQALQASTLRQEVDRNQVIAKAISKHKEYILSEKVRASDEIFTTVIGQQVPMVELVIEFDAKKMAELLKLTNLSTLDETRVETLAVVLVQQQDGTTEILAREDLYALKPESNSAQNTEISQLDEQTRQDLALLEGNIEGELNLPEQQTIHSPFYESIVQLLDQSAQQLKLPIIWPMMDPQDLFFFDQSNFWQVDKDSILGFAKRYKAKVILIARIKQHQDGRFIGEWNVLDLGRPKVQYYETLEDFTASGLKQLSQTIMQQYGINPNDKKDEQVLVRMNQVNNVTDFHQNEVFLRKLTGVESVVALNVNGGEVTYLLQLSVSQKQFLTNLELNDSLGFFIEDELRRPIIINAVISEFE